MVVGVFGAEGRWFDSTSRRRVVTLGKSFICNCLNDVLWRPMAEIRKFLSGKIPPRKFPPGNFPPRKFPSEHFPPYVCQVVYMFACRHVYLSNVLFNYPASS